MVARFTITIFLLCVWLVTIVMNNEVRVAGAVLQPQPPETGFGTSIVVSDQPVDNDSITIGQVQVWSPAWLVVYKLGPDGEPDLILGAKAIQPGMYANAVITFDGADSQMTAGDSVYVRLHRDSGLLNQFEFPGVDEPLTVNDQMIAASFTVLPPPKPSAAPLPETGMITHEAPTLTLSALLMLMCGLILLWHGRTSQYIHPPLPALALDGAWTKAPPRHGFRLMLRQAHGLRIIE